MVAVATSARREFAKPFFAEVVFTAWGNIWMVSNDKCVKHERHSFSKWKYGFIHDLTLLGYRIKPKFKDELLRWIDFLPP